jgi:hypothetical protein
MGVIMKHMKSLVVLAMAGMALASVARSAVDPALILIKKYVASYEKDAFLADPAVGPQLTKMMGPKLATLKLYLDAAGPVEYYGGALSVSGNAPHAGLERMAVVCVLPYGPNNRPAVEVALFDMGKIVVYSAQPKYDYTSQCIKDWIGLANTQFTARMNKPANVQLISK